jgi:zinc transporter 1/2/3
LKQAHPHHNHDHDDHHGHSHGKKEFSSLTPYLLLFALCLDGFFEGLAIGSQSSLTKLIFTGICLLINKCIVAFNLGISFKIAVPDIRVFIRFVLLFSLFTPFGILLAFIFYTYNPLIKGTFLALASGSFIYVSTSVIIIEEFTVTKYKYTKFLLFLLGGIGTAFVIYLTDNN